MTDKLNITDELLKLAELKNKGILTDEEFSAAKAALLRALHSAAPPNPQGADDTRSSLTNDLERFKAAFAAENSAVKLRALLFQAEDLLIHICGEHRYASFKRDIDTAVSSEEGFMRRFRETNMFHESSRSKLRSQAASAGDDIKRRIAGIEYRT